jgi:hypothetical protein
MIITKELWVLDRVEGDLALDKIANVWAAVTGWEAYVWGTMLALLLLMAGFTYLLSLRRRTRH